MRILAGCVLLASAILAPQQSSSEYHSLYGASDLERFQVRPGITLTVQYGPDGLACQESIEAARPLVGPRDKMAMTTLLPMNEVDQILEDVVPSGIRGAKLRDLGGWHSGITFESGEDYENVTISRVSQDCQAAPNKCIAGTSVTYKRKSCDSLNENIQYMQRGDVSSAKTSR
jgi:hypothetical protein